MVIVAVCHFSSTCTLWSLGSLDTPPGTMMTLIVSSPSMILSSILVIGVNVMSFSVLLTLYVNLGTVGLKEKSDCKPPIL